MHEHAEQQNVSAHLWHINLYKVPNSSFVAQVNLLEASLTSILSSYPLSCIRLQPVQRCSRLDLQGALGSFLSDVRGSLQSVCGFPAHLTSKPRYHTVSLNTATSVQVRLHICPTDSKHLFCSWV